MAENADSSVLDTDGRNAMDARLEAHTAAASEGLQNSQILLSSRASIPTGIEAINSVRDSTSVPSAPEDIRRAVEMEVLKLIQTVEKSTQEKGIEKDASQEEEAIDLDNCDKQPGLEQSNYEALIQEAKEEIKDLSIENKVLQRRLLALQKRRSTIGTKLFLEGADTQYQIVAREARHIHSGRKLSKILLDELHNEDREVDVEIERLRIEGRQLTSQLKKTQQAILKKDQLPCDLFAVDFEQQKIENESLHEKLAKKNKELEELGKKTTHIVHVLTHSREKLQFVQKETEGNTQALDALEAELTKARSELQRINITCEKLQLKKAKMQNIVVVRKPSLLDDMEASREEADASEKKLKELKQHYDMLVTQIQRKQQVILQDSSNCALGSPTHEINNNTYVR